MGSSPLSISTTPRAASVVSMPSAVPRREPALGTRSMGRVLAPVRMRLLDVSSLEAERFVEGAVTGAPGGVT